MGGLLGGNGALRLALVGDRLWNTTAAGYTLRVKLGGTTLHQQYLLNAVTSSRRGWRLDVLLQNITAASQRATTTIVAYNIGAAYDYANTLYGVATEDTASNKALVITVQNDTASTAVDWTVRHGILEIIKPTLA